MTATSRRVRALALLASCLSLVATTACTGRNEGRSDPAGGSSNGAGPLPPAGPRAGQNTDTTMIPAAAGAATAGAAATTPAASAPAGTTPAGTTPAAPATKAPAATAPATRTP